MSIHFSGFALSIQNMVEEVIRKLLTVGDGYWLENIGAGFHLVAGVRTRHASSCLR